MVFLMSSRFRRKHDVREEMENGADVTVRNVTQDAEFTAEHTLSPRQVDVVLQGGLIEDFKN